MKLKDRVAIVTGGGRGIGRAITLRLAEQGAHVVIAGTTLEPLQQVAAEVEKAGGKALVVQMDVSQRDSVRNMVAKTLEHFGRIDILVNNAGGSARGKMSLFADSEEDTWDYVLSTNLKGVFYTCREIIGHMLERGQGNIINIGSVAGIVGFASQVDYSAAKGGVLAFTKALAKETSARGVRVNSVSPGPIASEAARQIPPEVRERMMQSAVYQALNNSTGFGHFGEPDDIAHLVTFLASDDAKFITGQDYPVCGVMNLGLNERLGG